jgi:hypothetical protein
MARCGTNRDATTGDYCQGPQARRGAPYEQLAIALWLMMSWLHEIAARHSAYLVVTSAEPESGKTTLLGVLRFLVPKPLTGVEPTGASIFRVVDREKPTQIIDEADDLFHRKTDVKHIFNAGWTRGPKVPSSFGQKSLTTRLWISSTSTTRSLPSSGGK